MINDCARLQRDSATQSAQELKLSSCVSNPKAKSSVDDVYFDIMKLTQRLSVVALVCCAAALCSLPAAVEGQSTLEVECCGPHQLAARVVLLSDSHVMAPQQDLQHLGSNEVDVLTVLKSQARLWQVVTQKINSLVPAPSLALFGGDLVHQGLGPSQDLDALLHGPLNGFHIAKGLLDQLAMPLVLGLGNHDYKVECPHLHLWQMLHATPSCPAHLVAPALNAKEHAMQYSERPCRTNAQQTTAGNLTTAA
jgi:hypothetical protein